MAWTEAPAPGGSRRQPQSPRLPPPRLSSTLPKPTQLIRKAARIERLGSVGRVEASVRGLPFTELHAIARFSSLISRAGDQIVP
jgi:hypothetical protein